MNRRNVWSREEILQLLDIMRSSCLSFLDGTLCHRNGQMYRQIQYEMQQRGTFTTRSPQQIEQKWKNLKMNYDKYKNDLAVQGPGLAKPCDFLEELQELFDLAAHQPTILVDPTIETIDVVEDDTYYEEEFVADETQELSVDEDAVVIEEIVYDSQDALEFEEEAAVAAVTNITSSAPSTSVPSKTRRKKLTADNMDKLLQRISGLQKEHNEQFIRQQMELIENEFESFREKEKDHLLQLKLDLEVLKQKFLVRIQKIASGDVVFEVAEEKTANQPKRRRVGGVVPRRRGVN